MRIHQKHIRINIENDMGMLPEYRAKLRQELET